MASTRTLGGIVRASNTLEEIIRYLEDRTTNMAILFIDLCDSTRLKTKPQTEWLPIICKFLFTVSQIVTDKGGRIVKYIGDEVFSVFPEDKNLMASLRAENCIWECESELSKLGESYRAKYTLDYGSGAAVDFPNAPKDVLGTCIDRCARIAKLNEPHTALASHDFVEHSKHKASWSLLGQFDFRGITQKVKVYQLQDLGNPIRIPDDQLYTADSKHLVEIVIKLRGQNKKLLDELNYFRSRQ
jgi:class 3 adenylate cyclase